MLRKFVVCLGFASLAVWAVTVETGAAESQLFPRNRAKVGTVNPIPNAPKTAPLPMAQPAGAGESKKLGPVACVVIRQKLRDEYKKQGMGLVERIRKSNEATDDVINGLMADAEKVAAAKVAGAKFGAIGDGTIIQAIIDFFKSPQGQALIDALIQLLIGLLSSVGDMTGNIYCLEFLPTVEWRAA